MTRANKTGLVLASLLGLLDVINLFSINTPFPEGMTTPPDWLVILVAILGLVTLAAIVPAWRGNHRAVVVVVVVTRILSAISAVPAYFVNVPFYILITTTVLVVVTILARLVDTSKESGPREKRERVTWRVTGDRLDSAGPITAAPRNPTDCGLPHCSVWVTQGQGESRFACGQTFEVPSSPPRLGSPAEFGNHDHFKVCRRC